MKIYTFALISSFIIMGSFSTSVAAEGDPEETTPREQDQRELLGEGASCKKSANPNVADYLVNPRWITSKKNEKNSSKGFCVIQ